MSPFRNLLCAALFPVSAFLSSCATDDLTISRATGSESNPSLALVLFASNEGLTNLSRSSARVDFASLANQFEPQYNGAFCGPTSAAIVLNTMYNQSADLPRDHTRLREEDVQFMPPGADPIVPRFTQDSVLDKSPKTRAQVLGEAVSIAGKQVADFG